MSASSSSYSSEEEPIRQGRDANTVTKPPDVGLEGLKPAAEGLQDQTIIGNFFQRSRKYPRCVDVNLNVLFTSLHEMYNQRFQWYSDKLEKFMSYQSLPENYVNEPLSYAAAVYVSSFVHDLFVVNRESVHDLCVYDIGGLEQYFECCTHIGKASYAYDTFLCEVAACLKPTNIKNSHEDSLYIPRFHPNPDFKRKDYNYFDVPGFVMDRNCLYGIIETLSGSADLKFYPLPKSTLGRPFWLFDWHANGSVYAWFPQDDYTMEDVTLAYIVGVSCTPHLALRDYDEWQLFPGNIVPEYISISEYNRVRPLTYHGRVEYNEIDHQIDSRFPEELRELVHRNNAHGAPASCMVYKSHDFGQRELKRQRVTRELLGADMKGKRDNADDTEAAAESEEAIMLPQQVEFGSINRFRIVTYLYYSVVAKTGYFPERYDTFCKLLTARRFGTLDP